MKRPLENKYRFNAGSGFYLPEQKMSYASANEIDFSRLPPFLRTLLVTDGTVTKFLEAYLWEPIRVETLYQEDVVLDHDIPWIDLKKGDGALRRGTRCVGIDSERIYLFADAWIRVDRLWEGFREDLTAGRLGMGELLRDRQTETYREILSIEQERAEKLADYLGMDADDPVFSRQYRIFSRQQASVLIKDVYPEALYGAL